MVLEVSAVNFGLLSDREQAAIIGSFAQMLNSLSFSIQIVIISERLNISSYLAVLDKAQKAQANPLLSEMITQYKQFIQGTIKENEVLDKKFYIVIPLFSIELGLTTSKTNLEQKIKTVLLPRKDQIIRQLSRVGLRATQINRQKLIEVFYNIYNGTVLEKPASQLVSPDQLAVRLKNPKPIEQSVQPVKQTPAAPQLEQPTPAQTPVQPVPPKAGSGQRTKTHPFVVEELE